MITPQNIPNIIMKHCPKYTNKINKMQVLKGLTNITYKISAEGLESLVFRKFGGNIDRKQENIIYHQLQKMKIAPKCEYACQTYRIQKFIDNGRHPSNQQLTDHTIIKRIVNKIHDFHKVVLPEEAKVAQILADSLFNQSQYQKIYSLKNNAKLNHFDLLQSQILARMADSEQFHKIIPTNKDTIRFCHNDLNNLNILITQAEVILIDFEYSKLNYLAYDIANFLNQTTIDYSLSISPGFQLIQTLTIRQIEQAVQQYPSRYDKLVEDVIRSLAACNLYWAIWSIVGATNPDKGIFSIVEHGLMRIKLYDKYLELLDQYFEAKQAN